MWTSSSSTRSSRSAAEVAPAHVGFDAAHQHDVAVAARRAACGQAGRRPLDLAGHAVDLADCGAVDLVVVVLLVVEFDEGFGVPDQFEVLDSRRLAASPASFQPSNAATSTGLRSSGDCLLSAGSRDPASGLCGDSDPSSLRRGAGLCAHYSGLPCPPPLNSALFDALKQRVVIGDGAMGTMLQAADLSLDDFRGLEGCNEILNDTRPDVIKGIHRAYFEAGADIVETNTFGCNLPNLADYDISDRIRDLSERGTASLGRSRTRWVRPPTGTSHRPRVDRARAPSCRPSATPRSPYCATPTREAALGMLEGGADAILVETCQDLLQAKAAIIGSRRAMEQAGPPHPDHRARHGRDHRHDAARLARSAPRSPRWSRSAST